jgi:serine/threonine-protein kinase
MQAALALVDVAPGTLLGERYELLGPIASGGMATVWLAHAHAAGGFKRLVAVKTCLPQLRADQDFVSMFLDEARLAAAIHHPNVIATLDLGDDKALYLVMDYVEGPTLAAMMRKGRVPQAIALRIVHDALLGLHAAHELRDEDGVRLDVVHRDVSPQNILVGLDGGARVMDFGIAKARSRATVTQEGVVKGKLAYMAPEQIGSAPVDRRSDVFAMGVLLWELLLAKRLFHGSSPQETLGRVLHAEVTPPSEVDATVPAALDPMVLCALSRAMSDRFETALDFANALVASEVPMAPVSEVAAYLDAHFGEKLRGRREELTRSATKTSHRGIVEAESVAAEKNAAEKNAPEQSVVQRIARTSADQSPHRASRRWALGIAAVIVMTGAGAAWAMTRGAPAETVAALPPLAQPEAPSVVSAPPVAPPPSIPVVSAPASPTEAEPTRPPRPRPRAEPRRQPNARPATNMAATTAEPARPRIQPIDDGEW